MMHRTLTWGCRGALVAWAGFWTWFAVAGAFTPGHGWSEVWSVAVPAIVLTGVAWRWPVIGGVLLVAAGLFSVWFFDHLTARLLLSLPVVVIGLVLLTIGAAPSGRAQANAA